MEKPRGWQTRGCKVFFNYIGVGRDHKGRMFTVECRAIRDEEAKFAIEFIKRRLNEPYR